jgi:hypothetical protein
VVVHKDSGIRIGPGPKRHPYFSEKAFHALRWIRAGVRCPRSLLRKSKPPSLPTPTSPRLFSRYSPSSSTAR